MGQPPFYGDNSLMVDLVCSFKLNHVFLFIFFWGGGRMAPRPQPWPGTGFSGDQLGRSAWPPRVGLVGQLSQVYEGQVSWDVDWPGLVRMVNRVLFMAYSLV